MNRFTSMSALLEELSPDVPASGRGWDDVLARVELGGTASKPGRAHVRRRGVLIGALAAAVLIPLVALAAANDWWFFRYRDVPRPLDNKPVVVETGSWNGHRWEMVAYTSADGTCWAITFPDAKEIGGSGAFPVSHGITGSGASALSCGGIVGLRPPNPGAIDLPTVMYMIAGNTAPGTDYPNWLAGPVVESAVSVVVRFRNGGVVKVPTSHIVTLGHVGWYGPVRFFAAPYPRDVVPFQWPRSITGFDKHGNVVACAVPTGRSRAAYLSPLSECRR